jgi:hypothetical protein
MKIIFEDKRDGTSFLDICRIITKVIEENERFKLDGQVNLPTRFKYLIKLNK